MKKSLFLTIWPSNRNLIRMNFVHHSQCVMKWGHELIFLFFLHRHLEMLWFRTVGPHARDVLPTGSTGWASQPSVFTGFQHNVTKAWYVFRFSASFSLTAHTLLNFNPAVTQRHQTTGLEHLKIHTVDEIFFFKLKNLRSHEQDSTWPQSFFKSSQDK